MILIYDNSFYGLLTCVYYHYYEKKVGEIYAEKYFQGSVIDEPIIVETNIEQAKKVEKAIRDKFSVQGYMDLYRTFLSNDRHKDCYILEYLIMGFKLGRKIDHYYTEPFVHNVRKLSKKVAIESHRFQGILRFEQRGPYLYAQFQPEHDVLPLIAGHFTDRLKEEQLIIHDKNRHKTLLAQSGKWLIQELMNVQEEELLKNLPASDQEKMFQELWKGYFNHIAVEGRYNPKLQQNFLPKKYRKDMVEFK